MENTFKKAVCSITMEPTEDGRINTKMHLEGAGDDLSIAFVELSKHLLKTYEEKYGEEFVKGLYAIMQTQIIEGSCLKKSYDEHSKQMEKAMALASIFGKTFDMSDKEGDEE
jgi:hypothetical protein